MSGWVGLQKFIYIRFCLDLILTRGFLGGVEVERI
jgi:hypothetical protein